MNATTNPPSDQAVRGNVRITISTIRADGSSVGKGINVTVRRNRPKTIRASEGTDDATVTLKLTSNVFSEARYVRDQTTVAFDGRSVNWGQGTTDTI